MINIIVAISINGVIGKGGRIPWRIPNDLTYFKVTTMGHPIVMGRKTYESIGKPLPGRVNIVLTRDRDYVVPGGVVTDSIDYVMELARKQDVFVIGGAQVYEVFLPMAGRLYITNVYREFEGDSFFPPFDKTIWRLIYKSPLHDVPIPYQHFIYEYVP